MNVTGRRTAEASTTGSMLLRWLDARITGPTSGMCSSPSNRIRNQVRINGFTTTAAIRYPRSGFFALRPARPCAPAGASPPEAEGSGGAGGPAGGSGAAGELDPGAGPDEASGAAGELDPGGGPGGLLGGAPAASLVGARGAWGLGPPIIAGGWLWWPR